MSARFRVTDGLLMDDPLHNATAELREAVEAMGGEPFLAAIDELVEANEEYTVSWFDARWDDETAEEVIDWSIETLALTAPGLAHAALDVVLRTYPVEEAGDDDDDDDDDSLLGATSVTAFIRIAFDPEIRAERYELDFSDLGEWITSDIIRFVDEPIAAAAPSIGERLDRAFALARELHSAQVRKGTEIPYLSHLMGVASLVLEDGGDEEEAIAALLHDATEDQGGEATLDQIRDLFGSRVADLVEACSEIRPLPEPPWRERKEGYLAHLKDPELPEGAIRVSLADKLHNARATLFDLRAGQDVFARFNADREDQQWWYDALATAFAEVTDSPMAAELRRIVDDLFAEDSAQANPNSVDAQGAP